ncbi:hypothetical protein O3P69_009088 [Scylla paramamosain]|uniref:Uncharacterized protein n=1 Tax=Scylla paramamosain TaxID=85552 RepID=A0AAW0TRB4_SCYPA
MASPLAPFSPFFIRSVPASPSLPSPSRRPPPTTHNGPRHRIRTAHCFLVSSLPASVLSLLTKPVRGAGSTLHDMHQNNIHLRGGAAADVMRTITSTTTTTTSTASSTSSLKATTSTTRPASRHTTPARRHTASHLRIQKTSRLSENIQDNHTFKSYTPHPSPPPPGSSRPAWESFLRVLSQHSCSLLRPPAEEELQNLNDVMQVCVTLRRCVVHEPVPPRILAH